MQNEKTLLYKKDGKYIPYDTINKDLCVLYGDKEYILKRVKETIDKYYSDNIDLYNSIERIINDFYNNYVNNNVNNNDMIYAYDFKLNRIVPINDFYIYFKDSILTSSDEEIGSYVRKKKIGSWYYLC